MSNTISLERQVAHLKPTQVSTVFSSILEFYTKVGSLISFFFIKRRLQDFNGILPYPACRIVKTGVLKGYSERVLFWRDLKFISKDIIVLLWTSRNSEPACSKEYKRIKIWLIIFNCLSYLIQICQIISLFLPTPFVQPWLYPRLFLPF